MNHLKNSVIFRDPSWLREHIFSILEFYYPTCIDFENGGYYSCFLDDGTICDDKTKHLVSTCRFIYNFSIGAILRGSPAYVPAAEHGLRFLQNHHLDQINGGYFWLLKGNKLAESNKYAYGHAFVLLAASRAYQAGIKWARTIIEYVFDVLEDHFWQEEHELYADQISSDWTNVSPYRGQNANMHLCEAMLAAFESTNDTKYLQRAYQLAKSVTIKLASQSGVLIWEHYDVNWNIDWTYIETSQSKREFRPYGFIPGHSIEWSKLLLILERHVAQPWLVQRARQLFQSAWSKSQDIQYGGLFYSLTPEGALMDTDKYYWVMAETIGASALLAERLEEEFYWNVYDLTFAYSSVYLIDHRYGGWYQKLYRTNLKYGNVKSPPPKTDYHPIANCYEAIRSFINTRN